MVEELDLVVFSPPRAIWRDLFTWLVDLRELVRHQSFDRIVSCSKMSAGIPLSRLYIRNFLDPYRFDDSQLHRTFNNLNTVFTKKLVDQTQNDDVNRVLFVEIRGLLLVLWYPKYDITVERDLHVVVSLNSTRCTGLSSKNSTKIYVTVRWQPI